MLTPLWGMLPSSSTCCTLWIWPKNIMFIFNIIWQSGCQLGRPLISWVNTFRRTNTVVPWPVLFLLKLWWPVWWVNWWSADEIITLLITNFWVEDFREKVLDQTIFKALCGCHHMDDTFVICPHWSERLEGFLECMNGVHQNITFAMEMERDGCICIRASGLLDHKVYRKTTNTDR